VRLDVVGVIAPKADCTYAACMMLPCALWQTDAELKVRLNTFVSIPDSLRQPPLPCCWKCPELGIIVTKCVVSRASLSPMVCNLGQYVGKRCIRVCATHLR
jgi:hypothetical protein